jgi:hypothetical protein
MYTVPSSRDLKYLPCAHENLPFLTFQSSTLPKSSDAPLKSGVVIFARDSLFNCTEKTCKVHVNWLALNSIVCLKYLQNPRLYTRTLQELPRMSHRLYQNSILTPLQTAHFSQWPSSFSDCVIYIGAKNFWVMCSRGYNQFAIARFETNHHTYHPFQFSTMVKCPKRLQLIWWFKSPPKRISTLSLALRQIRPLLLHASFFAWAWDTKQYNHSYPQ